MIFLGNFIFLLTFITLIYNFFFISELSYSRLNSVYFLLVNITLYLLMFNFLLSEFSVYIVLLNSYSVQAIIYKLFGVWCSHEGSIFFWFWCFSAYFFIIQFLLSNISILFYRVYYFLNGLLFCYIIFFSNPFTFLDFFIYEGLELNYILHNPLVSIHPPILYAGYLFTFFISTYFFISLYLHSFNWSMLYTLYFLVSAAWIFLSFGIFLGSFWAYNELGWGGWWYWDAIENLAFLPWIVLLYCLHVIKYMLNYNILVVSWLYPVGLSFLLVLVGTFFLRSGNLDSIHNFVVDLSRGYILIIFVTLLLYFYIIYLYKLKNFARLSYFVDFKFLSNNSTYFLYVSLVVILVYCVYIYWGTFFPFFIKIFFSRAISLDSSYYINFTAYCSILTFLLIFTYFSNLYKCSLLLFIVSYFAIICFSIVGLSFPSYTLLFGGLFSVLFVYYRYMFARISFSLIIHLVFLFIILVAVYMSIAQYTYLFNIKPYDLIDLGNNFLFCVGMPFTSYNTYFISDILPLFIYSEGSLVELAFLEKNLFFNSNNFFVRPEVLMFSNYDLYCVLGPGNNQSGWQLKMSVKPYMSLFWCLWLMVFFLSCYSIWLFYKKSKRFINAL